MSDLNVMSGTRSTPPRQALHSEPAVAAETAQVLASSDTFEGLSHRSRQFASLAARLQGRTHATPASASMQPAEAGAGADSAIAQMRGQAEANARWLGQLHGRTERIAGDTVLQRMALLEVQSFAAFAGAEAQPGRALSLSPPESSEVEALQGKMRRQLQALADQPVSSDAAAARASGDFFDSLKGLIDLIGSDYLEVYERLIKQYSDMFSDFNKEVMAKMGEWTKGVNDGKEVEFNSKAFVAALSSLLIKYQSAPTSVVFPVPDAAGSIPVVTKEDAAAWAKAMAKGAGWTRLSAPHRRFALFHMGARTNCEAVDQVPMDMRQEAVGLSALYSLQTTLPHALAVRMPLLFSPGAQAWQARVPDVQCPPVIFHMAVQHARFDQART